MKACTICNETKPLEDFVKQAKMRDGYKNQCKACQNKRQRDYHRPNPERRREYKLKAHYGIDNKDYDAMLAAQNGCCLICGTKEGNNHHGKLFVDHCHETNKVRGLLCHHCNSAIGHMKDDVHILAAAIAYLKENK